MNKNIRNIYLFAIASLSIWILLQRGSSKAVYWEAGIVLVFVGLFLVLEAHRLIKLNKKWEASIVRNFTLGTDRFHYGNEDAFLNQYAWFFTASEIIIGVTVYHRASKLTYMALAPLRHHHVIYAIDLKHGGGPQVRRDDQGFMTNHGRIVTRREALVIATTAGQVIRRSSRGDELYSEDVWNTYI